LNDDPLAGLDEPVRRYFTHALGAALRPARGVHLKTKGRVKADLWLPFRAEQEIDGRSFGWRARVGLGPLTLVRVVDGYAHGVGSSEGLLFGRRPLFSRGGEDTTRSAAGRTALESVVFAAPCVLPQGGVAWRAESEDTIVARFALPPERPEVEVRIDPRGAVTQVSAARWGPREEGRYDYIPCGCAVHAERRFGDLTIPSRITVSWQFGTPSEAPFLRAELTEARPVAP
jgi:hypothetical protein